MSYDRPPGLPIVDAKTPAVLVPARPVTRDEVAGLCAELRALLEARTGAGAVLVEIEVVGPGPRGSVPSTSWPASR